MKHALSFALAIFTCTATYADTHDSKDTRPSGDASVVTQLPGLVAFWTFGEATGQPRESIGSEQNYPLVKVDGPIQRVEGGPFSGYAANLHANLCKNDSVKRCRCSQTSLSDQAAFFVSNRSPLV